MRKFILALALTLFALTASANPSIDSAANSVVALDIRTPGGGGYCSGFVYKPGVVVTAAHCLEKATFVRVFTRDGRSDIARIVGKNDSADVAVLKLTTLALPALPLRISAPPVASEVYAIGHPKRNGWTITRGVVSRADAPPGSYDATYGISSNLIQTDALIFHGCSGGVLLSADGRVIGMLTGVGTVFFIGFAVPASTVVDEADKLLK